MGLLKGKASFTTFKVPTFVQTFDIITFVRDQLRAFAFRDIDDTFDNVSVGWVSIHDMFSVDFSSAITSYYVAMALRIDERTVPGAVFRKFVAKEEQRFREERQVRRLSRMTRLQIKERVHAELVRKAKPAPKVVEMVWNTHLSTLTVFTTGSRVLNIVEAFFKETFGLAINQTVNDDDLSIRRDFLTWLFCDFMLNGGETIKELPKITVDGDYVKVSCMNDAQCEEAVWAMVKSPGARVSRITVALDNDGLQYTIDAKKFDFTSVRLPKNFPLENVETTEEWLFWDRVGLFETVIDHLNDSYDRFVSAKADIDVEQVISNLSKARNLFVSHN